MGQASRRQSWSRYWASGALHSCVTSYHENYAGTLGQGWLDAMGRLTRGARVLDLATGNGSLPKLAVDHLSELELEFDAVDLAELRPTWCQALGAEQRARLRFHSGIAAEQLPFPAECFDMVISQFGIEYSNRRQSHPESVRVLKSGGKWSAVVHHAQSIIVHNARDELRHGEWLFQPNGLLATVHDLSPLFERARTAEGRIGLDRDPAAHELRDRFNGLQEELERRADRSVCPDLLHEARRLTGQVLMAAGSGDSRSGQNQLAQFREAWVDSCLRLTDLVRCALDDAELSDWQRQLGLLGVQTEAAAVHEGSHLLAWRLVGAKVL